jgi:hypothetical protein
MLDMTITTAAPENIITPEAIAEAVKRQKVVL